MKLHSPQFEKGLRRAVKRAVRSSPALKREAKRGRLRRHFSANPLLRLAASALLGVLVWQAHQATGHHAAALALMTLWAFMLAFLQGANLLNCLFQSPDLAVLSGLPISGADVFRWQRQRFVLNSIYSALDILVGFIVLSCLCELSTVAWIALLPLTLIAMLGITGTAAFLATRFPRVVALAPLAVFVGFLAMLGVQKIVPLEVIWQQLDRQATWIMALLPTGWGIALFQLMLPQPHSLMLLFVPLTAVLVWSLQNSFARLQTEYDFHEIQIPDSSDLIPEGAVEAAFAVRPDGEPQHVGVTAIEEIIQARLFLAAPGWSRGGWLERWLWQWLTLRERVVAEFAFVDGLSLSAAWKKIYRNLLIGATAGFALGYVSPVGGAWTTGITLFVTLCQLLAQVLATGAAFQKTACSGVNVPVYAVHAVGYHELSRVLIKHTVVQLPLVVPFMIMATLLIYQLCGVPNVSVWVATVLGVKTTCLLAAARLPTVALGFSAGTNDSSQFRFHSVFLVLMFVFLGLTFVGLGVAALFVPVIWMSWVFCLLAVLDALALFGFYGWRYNANRFDLMSLPQR